MPQLFCHKKDRILSYFKTPFHLKCISPTLSLLFCIYLYMFLFCFKTSSNNSYSVALVINTFANPSSNRNCIFYRNSLAQTRKRNCHYKIKMHTNCTNPFSAIHKTAHATPFPTPQNHYRPATSNYDISQLQPLNAANNPCVRAQLTSHLSLFRSFANGTKGERSHKKRFVISTNNSFKPTTLSVYICAQ